MIWPKRPAPALPSLAAPVAVIGDIHGRDDLLARLLEQLARAPEAPRMRVVCVGDMVDRGPDSAAVLHRLNALEATPDPFASLTCLMGNHDQMLLDFLADPVRHGPRWLHHGGEQTLASFGLTSSRPVTGQDATSRLEALSDDLSRAMGPALVQWLAARPLSWQDDPLWVTHAGADPRRRLADQGAAEFLWGGPRFYDTPRRDGAWVIHGHTIVEAPVQAAGRIAVDTGAWRTERLTAAVLAEGTLRFLST